MTTFKKYLELDGSIGFNSALYNRFSNIGDSCYAGICGGFIDGVYQWATHNISFVSECKNEKYTGWTIRFNDNARGESIEKKVYIENWVLKLEPKDWKHAKNLFSKYLREAPQK